MDGGDSESTNTRYGLSAMQGWRQAMEDAHIAKPTADAVSKILDAEVAVYGVFDGHGGHTVSEWISRHMEDILASTVQELLNCAINQE